MKPYYADDHVTVYHGDCLDVLTLLPDASMHAVCTDPPYELGFMGKGWDASGIAYKVDLWRECLRVLKPGGHLLAFGGTRTWHRLACAIEDAGFEMRDSVAWLYGSGFPKSLDVSKAIDKAAGAEREVVGVREDFAARANRQRVGVSWADSTVADGSFSNPGSVGQITAPATDAAKQWEGWGTALKPAHEPVVCARKPLSGTVAATVQEHGTGALNIHACRVGMRDQRALNRKVSIGYGGSEPQGAAVDGGVGRWPTNVVLDESQAAELDQQSGLLTSGTNAVRTKVGSFLEHGGLGKAGDVQITYGDSGGASRFFPVFRYEAKADAAERPRVDGVAHPTVKPVALMRWLVRLVTPPGGTVLDPFAGSGTTLQAARAEGFDVIGIEREADYLPLIRERLERIGSPVNADDGGWPGPRKTEGQASMFDLLGGDAA